MPLVSIRFRFSQRFAFPARTVFRWATDYQADDIERLGQKGRRQVERLNEDTLLLTDTILTEDGGRTVKEKLVRLYPEQFSWTNTHLSGSNRHSQFLYELVPEGEQTCHLEFTGRQLVEMAAVDPRLKAELARSLRKDDSEIWKNLARMMAADLKPPAAKPAARRR